MTNIEVEDLSSIKKKITVEVPQEKVLEVVGAQYKDLKKNVQLKGFRKGKVPLNILRSYFKSKVQEDVARQLIEDSLQPGLDERKIKPLTVLKIDQESVEEGKPFKYTAEIEVLPRIEVQGYKGLKLKKYVRKATEEQLREQIEHLRERNARLSPIPDTRGVAQGDHLLVDVKAQVDGEAVPALTVSEYHLEMGRNFYVPGFDSHLEGMKPEETREITLDLPADFPRKILAGKTGTFQVTLKEAKTKVLAEVDDDFAKDLGEFETLEDLKTKLKKELEAMLETRSSRELESQIVDALAAENPFEVPESMVDAEITSFFNQSLQQIMGQGHDLSRLPPPSQAYRDQMRPAAVKNIQRFIMLEAIAEQEGVQATDEEAFEEIAKKAEQMSVTADFLKDRLEQDNRMEDIKVAVVEQKTVKLILDHAEITEEEPPVEGAQQESEAEKA